NADGYRVFSSSGTKSSHKIVISGVTTTITLDSVIIETTDGKSAIDIDDASDVELIVSGENSLTVNNTVTGAGIHISGGSLTISGTDSDDDVLNVLNASSYGATIGSNNGEDFTGTITVDSGVTVNAGIDVINLYHEGAGIGSGESGDMSGTIVINDGSVVNAISKSGGAGIGSGGAGDMNGSIIINGGDVTADGKIAGAGIGSGVLGSLNGSIQINGGTVNADSSQLGAGIGSGLEGDLNGEIIINDGNVNVNGAGSGIGIGTGIYGLANGDIIIHSDAVVTLENDSKIGAYYESTGTIYLYKGAEINGITVTDIDELKDAGILNDNMNAEIVEEETGETYSLGKLNNVSRIKTAKSGDTVYIYESQLSKGKLPYYVLEALAKTDNVTLIVVSDSGETAEIKSSSIPEKGKNAFFTVDELLDMAK
ncbi:MAG: hypothetical protein VB119_11270, partial [Candidatus Metalachnospira sp.]|nr:hypothetical protein [Candidatus Metalachnospira sp.]